MTVTQGPDACHIASSVAPSFPPLQPDPSIFFCARPSLALHPPGAAVEQCPKQRAPRSAGSVVSGDLGKVSSRCPRGDPAGCFAGFISSVLIIAAPGGIVPYYYTVDLYLIRHHLKPSAPSWHPGSPRIPPASACPFALLLLHRPSYSFRTESKKSSLIFIQQRPVNLETPGADESRPGRSSELAQGGRGSLPSCPPYPRLRVEMSLRSGWLSGCSPLREQHKGALPAGVQASSISSA